MPIHKHFKNCPAIVLGTGPSLEKEQDLIIVLQKMLSGSMFPLVIFGVNNTFNDFDLDVWIACDPNWHKHFGKIEGPFIKYHWDINICREYGYNFIQGFWENGLSLNKNYIHYNHASSIQALNLAVLHECNPIYLCGHDMKYTPGGPRHYFSGLSDQDGEYPEPLRKYSEFDGRGIGSGGLLQCYKNVAVQFYEDYPLCRKVRHGLPRIYNCTENSAMTCFPYKSLRSIIGEERTYTEDKK